MKNSFIFFMLLVLTYSGCTNDLDPATAKPQASFFIRNNNCKAPCDVFFYNTTKGGFGEKFVWDFGTGDTAHAFETRYRYTQSGEYNIVLQASNKSGSSRAEQKLIIQKDLSLNIFNFCRFEAVIVEKIPAFKPDSSPWDALPLPDALPDLRWRVYRGTVFYGQNEDSSNNLNVSDAKLPLTMIREQRYTPVKNFDDVLTLFILDEDAPQPDTLAKFNFRPVDFFPQQTSASGSPNNFRSAVPLSNDQGVQITAILAWL